MHPSISTKGPKALAAVITATLAATANAQIDDSIRGEASEANHFISTPDGWEQPRTP